MPTEETIVLDDDDEDDCYEVMDMDKASVATLIPEEELMQADQAPEGEEVVLPIDAPEQRLATKVTSTTDLDSCAVVPTAALSDRIVETSPCCAPAPVPVPLPEESSDLVYLPPGDVAAPALIQPGLAGPS